MIPINALDVGPLSKAASVTTNAGIHVAWLSNEMAAHRYVFAQVSWRTAKAFMVGIGFNARPMNPPCLMKFPQKPASGVARMFAPVAAIP
jgi:hypothetical protein